MFQVLKKRCDQCLFSDAKIVSDARRRAVLNDCARKDTHFVCHKSSITGGDACCRGFYDDAMGPDGRPTQLMRIAGRLRAIEFIDVPDIDTELMSHRDMDVPDDDAEFAEED